MSAADLMKADFDYAIAGFFTEEIGYKSLSVSPESSLQWTTINAVVERSAEPRGLTSERGRSPIIVSVSKSDISSVTEGVDKVRLDGDNNKVYSVAEIISVDAGGWGLYCA